MDSVTLKNYRCFREEQTARLAPLTLLVGENSTGKTSFLAILRALWDAAFADRAPDFREEPYDLGSFEDVVYNRGVGDTDAADSFEAGFVLSAHYLENGAVSFHSTFTDRDGVVFPTIRRISNKDAWIEAKSAEEKTVHFRLGVHGKIWERASEGVLSNNSTEVLPLYLYPPFEPEWDWSDGQIIGYDWDDSFPDECQLELLDGLSQIYGQDPIGITSRPFAGAPIHSRPRRTYDPIRPSRDPEGEYIPAYLANLYRGNSDEWQKLKASLEDFGRKSGLFDDISVMSFGKTSGAPFQIRIRKWGKRRKGAYRNLIDVGYGVSQALPMLTELLRPDSPQMFLLQQPEVHLHPSAQAALGSLFCDVASQRKQLIVETHSDYIIDRVRMDVRDKTTALKPDDVSILYFERDDLDVKIHSIRLDEMGNVLDAPHSYGKFFMEETRRSLGL